MAFQKTFTNDETGVTTSSWIIGRLICERKITSNTLDIFIRMDGYFSSLSYSENKIPISYKDLEFNMPVDLSLLNNNIIQFLYEAIKNVPNSEFGDAEMA